MTAKATKSIKATAGRWTSVTIEENPSTGYAWKLDPREKLPGGTRTAEAWNTSGKYNPVAPNGAVRVGGPAGHVFKFKFPAPGSYAIKFVEFTPTGAPAGARAETFNVRAPKPKQGKAKET